MPMTDVYARAGAFADTHQLAVDLATAVMTIEQVPTFRSSARTRRRSYLSCQGRHSRPLRATPRMCACRC